MKIAINNLGPIKRFEFDLSKDINVLFGKNNVGKSYAITAVYLLIKNLLNQNFRNSTELDYFVFRNHVRNRFEYAPKIFKEIDEVESMIISKLKDNDPLNITKEIKKLLAQAISQSLKEGLEKSFKSSFSSIDGLANKFSGRKFSIEVHFKDFSFSVLNDKSTIQINHVKLNKEIVIKKSLANRKQTEDDSTVTVYYNSKEKKDKNEYPILDKIMIDLYVAFKEEVSREIKNIYFLPASRSGLYQTLSAYGAIIAELSKSRNFLSNKLELPTMSEPVIDYCLHLANINNKRKNKKYAALVSALENRILQGKVSFNAESKRIVFEPHRIKLELDLAFTSSMISEIAPIAAFLKYIIADEAAVPHGHFMRGKRRSGKPPSNIIFIEEPEAHLHPEIQVRMMELFTQLAKHGIKIVMTTHSNYMFGKLSNLVLANKVKHENVGSYLMKMTAEGSLGDAASMAADEEGMKDENFAETAEKLYEDRISIYDKLNGKDADK